MGTNGTSEMALYVKQDFSPPFLSRRWLTMKFRPNMILYSRHHVVTVLESGLLFREDSIEVEEGMTAEEDGQWLTGGERVAALCAVAACVAVFPPKSLQKSTLIHLATYAALPVVIRTCHRLACKGMLPELIEVMRNYLVLSRRAAACVKEFAAMRADIGSVTSAVQSTHTMLCRQQQELIVVMSRASSALLGNAPWLHSDLAWDAIQNNNKAESENFLKVHHAFLVVQSTLLKHIAMAHFLPSVQEQKIYKNRNERIYWIHSVLIPHLAKDFKENYEALERMYRLLKNFATSDTNVDKKPGRMITDSWIYSDVHTGVARSNLELKMALEKCNSLDLFLDSCALNKQKIDLEVLNRDLEEVIDCIVRSLNSMQNSQLRLQKMRGKIDVADKKERDDESRMIENSGTDKNDSEIEVPQIKDEVFYFVKTDDDDREVQPMPDVTTMPGRKEKETTKIVLKELKRKLVKREDLMRERERQALINTMPEFKNNVPEFPRQMNVEDHHGKGFIGKIPKKRTKKKIHRHYRIRSKRAKCKVKYRLVTSTLSTEKELNNFIYEASSKVNPKANSKAKFLSVNKNKESFIITNWRTSFIIPDPNDLDFISTSEFSDINTSPLNGSLEPDHSALYELNLPEQESFPKNFEQGDIQQNAFEDGSSAYFKSILEDRTSPLHLKQNGGQLKQNGELEASCSKQNRQKGPCSSKDFHNLSETDEKSQSSSKYKFSKLDLVSSSSESDFDFYDDKQDSLLDDIRRSRAVRKKNFPAKRAITSECQDENLRPMEYSLCAGLAMAGVLQGGGGRPTLSEEVFTAEGEVETDSGNEN